MNASVVGMGYSVFMHDEIFSSLNKSQMEAVTTTEGAVRVIASAGSGKTRALTYRFLYLVLKLGIMPSSIMCVTFTNKAANEMRKRIHSLTGDRDTGLINTFHGFCAGLLDEECYAVGYPKSFMVLDNSDIDSLLSEIYQERGLTMRDMTYSDARDMIEVMKLSKIPDYHVGMIEKSLGELKKKYEESESVEDVIFNGYVYQERKCFALDYNDLLKFTLYIFQTRPEIARKWQERIEYIMVDEFQDIDKIQWKLMKVLSSYHGNVFVVGDPDQTIYSWRGADGRFLIDFDNAYPSALTISMLENYRSTSNIISVADSLIEKNEMRIEKRMIPMRKDEGRVVVNYAESSEKEAKWIVKEIKALRGKDVSYSDIAILYRAHHVSRSIEMALIGEKIPYVIYSGVPFFSRMEVKDALSYLRFITFKDDVSFRRIINTPRRNIGKKRMAFLAEYARIHGVGLYQALLDNLDNDLFRPTGAGEFARLIEKYSALCGEMKVGDLLSLLLAESGYEDDLRIKGSQERLDNIAELKQSISDFELSAGEDVSPGYYLNHVALFSTGDDPDEKEKVKLMTIHAAKGLEFKYVFIPSLNEGIFPSRKIRTKEEMEEERRLCYVAITRAKDGLYLSEADGRNFDGSVRYPSRFLLEIDQDLLDFVQSPPGWLLKDAREYIDKNNLCIQGEGAGSCYGPGDRIEHPVFGKGTVVVSGEKDGSYIIQFDKFKTTRRISKEITLYPS